jgi:hypothetical protein
MIDAIDSPYASIPSLMNLIHNRGLHANTLGSNALVIEELALDTKRRG